MKIINYQEIAKKARLEILNMHFLSQESHIGSAFSCIDILVVLYFKILRINPKNFLDENRDRFILSKSHAITALYAVLALRGFFNKEILKKYCKNESNLPGHGTKDSVCGVEVSTGSLGHGLPMGVGIALSGKMNKKNYRVFVLISDGECDEGSTWEAALFASHHKLDNLIVIIDYNKFQALGKTNEILNLEPLKDKWASFGWHVQEIDGHNFIKMEELFLSKSFQKNKPTVIIAHTVKGKGVSFMENQLMWHYKSPNKEQYNLANKEIKDEKNIH